MEKNRCPECNGVLLMIGRSGLCKNIKCSVFEVLFKGKIGVKK